MAIDQALPGRVFFLQLCDVAKLAFIHKKILAKFGYRSGLKSKTFNDLHSFGHLLERKREIWRFFENRKTEGVEIWRVEYQKKYALVFLALLGEKNPQLTNFSEEKKKKKRRVFAKESK